MLFTIEEVANILHIGRSTVFKLIKEGSIQSIKMGRSRRVPIDAMQNYVNDLVSESSASRSESTKVH
jgi:excisionase family DNA binding protein